MKKLLILVCTLVFGLAQAEQKPEGAYLGAKPAETPEWFKNSFLEFEDDVAEAAENGKRVMLYFHQDGCPYCAKLVEENFADPEIEAYVRQHFEAIEINMWGDRALVSVAGKTFSEKTFAAALKVQYTPTLVFLDEQGKTALRLNGYYPPQKLRLALKYVAQREEKKQRFNDFVVASLKPRGGALISEDFFIDESDLRKNRVNSERYLAVYFESADCEECTLLHEKVLTDGPTRKLATELDSVQFDLLGDAVITTPQGERMSQREFANRLNIGYTPSVVFFDSKGNEVHRVEGFLKTFHFQSSLAYVLEQGYLSEPSFQRYIAARGEKLREMGFDTDIWGYQSFHPGN